MILIAVVMVIPFLWMLSASVKSDREVFQMDPFAKLNFRHKNGLFLAYIATIAMPWQVYMVPRFIMMRKMELNDKLTAIICLQAFSVFDVFMMKQFYEGIPDDLCEAARIDGMSEYRIYASIMLPLSKPALSTLTIFTFVATWNDYLGPLIYLKSQDKKTIQLGLKMFISQYSSDYGLTSLYRGLRYAGYAVKDFEISNGLVLHSTYSNHSPYNTCDHKGVDECNAWGDYFYMEALTRM